MRRRGRERVGRRLRAAALLALGSAALLSGCGLKIVRLAHHGHYEEAVAVAGKRKGPPRGRAARAYAEALAELERYDQARAVLLADYRHGGDLRSLAALADLEWTLGLDGIAASHFGRVIELSDEALAGRQDVCALLRERASVWVAEGAGLAAERDLERADRACGEPLDAAEAAELVRLRARVDATAQAQVDARVERSRCTDECDDAAARVGQGVEAAMERARAQGPAALRHTAARLRVSLPPADVVSILSADLRGEAGTAIITDDEVRAMVGEQSWSAIAPVAMSKPDEVAAYLQLRFAAVMTDVPVTRRTRTGPGEADVWLATVVEAAGDEGWRVLAWAGDVTGAEIAISEVWRPKRRPAVEAESESEAAPEAEAAEGKGNDAPAPVDGIEAPAHWTSRVELSQRSLPVVLLEGRLRHAANQAERSLRIHRYAAARARAADLPDADALVAREAAWHLAHGRPWHALAVAEPMPRPHAQRVAAAAATALRLTRAFCGGTCKDDRDRDRVELLLGESWVREQETRLVEASRTRSRPAGPLDTCATLGELMSADATGRLAEVLREARSGEPEPGHARRLGEAIEADLGLGCAGRLVLPLLREGGHVATAGELAEQLSHDATLDAAGALTVHSGLAMVGGMPRRADLLATAAAASSSDPAATWRTLARHAHAAGHRELTLRALREALLHTPELDDPVLHRALVLVALAGIDEGWSLRETEAGRAEPAAHVQDLLARTDPASRWAVREELARALADQPWFDGDARLRLEPALWPDPTVAAAHPVAREWLALAGGAAPVLRADDVGTTSPAGLELLVTRRVLRELPEATEVFVEPERLQGARLALAEHGRAWVLRWRTAIGLAVHGDRHHRLLATRALLEMAEEGSRAALVEILLEDPAVVEPGAAGDLVEAPLLATPEDRLALVFDLPLDDLGL